MSNSTKTQPEIESDNRPQDAWERLGWIWSVLFIVSLVVSIVFAFRENLYTNGEIATIWILCSAMLIGHSLVVIHIRRNPLNFRDNQLAMVAYIIVLLGSTIWLISIDTAFYFLLFTAYGQVFSVLWMGYAIPIVLVFTGAMLSLQLQYAGRSFSLTDPFVLMYGIGTIGGLVMAYWIYSIIGQSMQRRELISELELAQSNLNEAERREGQLEERQRLSREIHDTLAQGFTSIVMHLEALEQELPEPTPKAQKHLDMARQTARDNLTAARRVVQDLRPELLEKEPLPAALERLVNRWSDETSIIARADTSGNLVDLHPQIEVTLLRATQEALTNIRKHAHASEASVTLTYFDEQVILDVQDNGIGLRQSKLNGSANIDTIHSGGFGLKAMRERVEQLEGSLSVESMPGEGTTLVVAIPT